MLFALKKLVAPFLLPPGLFVVVLFLSGVLLCRKRMIRGGLINLLLAILLWLLATGWGATRLVQPLEREQTIPSPLRGDVIVMLGGGIHDRVPDLTGSGCPSSDTLGRLVTAVRAYRRLKVPVIVSGGEVFAGTGSEAEVDRRFLVDLGVPADMVIMEGKSRDTMENARRCKEVLDRRGLSAPLLVTSAYHMRRSVLAFEKAGVKVLPLPAQFMVSPGRRPLWVELLPSATAFDRSTTALREYLGLLWYRFTP